MKQNLTVATKQTSQRCGIRNWIIMASLFSLFSSGGFVQAQSLLYSNAVVALKPAGYWPMHEVAAPAPADIETNYGSLGTLATGYYADWALNNGAPGTNSIDHQIPGPLMNDPAGGAYMAWPNTLTLPGLTGAISTNSYMVVPRTSPLTTLAPPFTLEVWVEQYCTPQTAMTNYSFGDIISEDGTLTNSGNANNSYGMRLTWGTSIQTYGNFGPGASFTYYANPPASGLSTNQWHHLAFTAAVSGGVTNFSLYVDGNLVIGPLPGRLPPDFWDPLTVGAGLWQANAGPLRETDIGIADFALYTNALSTLAISNDFNIATNAGSTAGQYYNAVIANQPVLFYRMDSPTFTGWAPTNTWPVAYNYGSAPANGVYMPGVTPGAVAGPNYYGLISTNNAMPGNGISAFADVGQNPMWNPTGQKPFSVIACFKGNPIQAQLESIVGHGDNSWHLRLDGVTGKLHFGTGAQSKDLVSTLQYNDANWHTAVGVYDGATNYLYVDDALDTFAANTIGTIGTNLDAMIAADPQYLNINDGSGMQFSGNVCEVAFFTNALTLSEVQSLYNAIGAPLSSISQPVLSKPGSSDVYTVTVSGSSPNYQWYINTTSNYSGATALIDTGGVSGSTTPSVTIANLADYYFAVATNNINSITSSIVQVPAVAVQMAGMPLWEVANPSNIVVVFTEPVDPVSGVNINNYTLSSGSVLSAAIGALPNKVVLNTTPLAAWNANPGTYSVTVQNVNGFYGNTVTQTTIPIGLYPSTALWLEGNNGVITDPSAPNWPANVAVQQWNDQSGNAADLYSYITGSAIEPFYTTNYHGNTAIQFSGTNCGVSYSGKPSGTFLYSASVNGNDYPSLEITGDLAIVSVETFNTLVGNTNGEIVGKTGSIHANEPGPYDNDVNSTPAISLLRGDGTNNTSVGSTKGPTLNVPHILAAMQQGSSISHFLDGASVGSAFVSRPEPYIDQGEPLCIGQRNDLVNRLNGQMFELIMFNTSLDTNDLVSLDNYLAAKYTVPIGTNAYPAITSQPTTVTNVYQYTTLTVPVGVTGNPLAMQWYSTNGTAITGQTNATLVIPNVQVTNSYYLVLTNMYYYTSITSSVVVANVIPINPNPTNIVAALTNSNWTLSWPVDHIGWLLQAQTNTVRVGISTNWFTVTGSGSTNKVVIPINLVNGTVFYRLMFP